MNHDGRESVIRPASTAIHHWERRPHGSGPTAEAEAEDERLVALVILGCTRSFERL